MLGQSDINSYTVAVWKEFCVAVSGASASFAGLLFVGLSINLTRFIDTPGIPKRAEETLIFPCTVLVSALLWPIQHSLVPYGFALLTVG
jgi:hypothetical protein